MPLNVPQKNIGLVQDLPPPIRPNGFALGSGFVVLSKSLSFIIESCTGQTKEVLVKLIQSFL